MERLNKIPIVILGAVNGLLFGILLETTFRSIFLYERYLLSLKPKGGFDINYSDYPFSWYFLPLLLLFSATFATFLIHRSAAGRIKSQIWFWQIIGIFTVLFSSLFIASYTLYLWYCLGFELFGEDALRYMIADQLQLSILFPIIAAFNLLFTFILKSLKSRLP